jgi:hypothetical protein
MSQTAVSCPTGQVGAVRSKSKILWILLIEYKDQSMNPEWLPVIRQWPASPVSLFVVGPGATLLALRFEEWRRECFTEVLNSISLVFPFTNYVFTYGVTPLTVWECCTPVSCYCKYPCAHGTVRTAVAVIELLQTKCRNFPWP